CQAQDGIRYLYVTGVQTCALPICSTGTTTSAGKDVGETTATATTAAPRRDGPRTPSRVPAAPTTTTMTTTATTEGAPTTAPPTQIGRASCREREGARVWGVTAA